MIINLRDATTATCGGKAGVLGHLMRAGLRVPDGFVVPPGISAEVVAEAVATHGVGDVAVAVRSSASTEDTAEASAAGQHDSFLGVRGVEAIVATVRACRESLWSQRAVAYRRTRGQTGVPEMAVLVQRMVDAEVAGVAFTGDTVRIEAAPGLGGNVVHGLVTPDSYTVTPHGVTPRRGGCLTDGQVHRTAETARRVEAVLGWPVDVEWALAAGGIWVLQARPVTAALPGGRRSGTPAAALSGTPGSSGTATGPARVLHSPTDPVEPGDIIVCRFTDPAWTPLFSIAAAFVTETGGVLSHAAIVAREHRIPAVLGVADAMSRIGDGQIITVHGDAGTVSTPEPPRGRQ